MNQEDHFKRWLALNVWNSDEIKALYALTEDKEAFAAAFSEPLRFGTAGLRGRMGVGQAQINEITVSWASASVARWLLEQGIENGHVLICGDSRHHSQTFIRAAAQVLISYGHRVTIWPTPTPVPVLSWAVRDQEAACGIAITASHNPKTDNGFKVYGPTGGQILEKDANRITHYFDQFVAGQELAPTVSLQESHQTGALRIFAPEDNNRYLSALILNNAMFSPLLRLNTKEVPQILYTPLFGSGAAFVPEALRAAGFTDTHTVASQMHPNGDFPDLTRPNPEDPEAFDAALRMAYVSGPDLVIATDPDCDRMGCAVRHQGDYVLLSGNQIAALIIDHLAQYLPRRDGDTVITTVVSSPFAKQLAQRRGLRVRETLTGFKYIGALAEDMHRNDDGHFFFGYEESYGYLSGDCTRDKDGVLASLLISSAARAAKVRKETLIDRLEALYQEVGTWYDRNFDITLPANGTAQMAAQLIDRIRGMRPDDVCGRPVRLRMDYQHGTLTLPPSNLLQFALPEGSVVSVRPSGTEAKIKCYVSACGSNHDDAQANAEALAAHLRQVIRQEKER